MSKKREDKQVVFRRVGGRVIPIAIGGAAIKRSMATRVYQKNDVTIDRRGKKLTMNIGGKRAGYSKIGTKVYLGEGDSKIKMVSLKEKFKGKGHGRTLITESARELRRRGKNTMFNTVVGNRAASITNKSDTFYDINRGDGPLFKRVDPSKYDVSEKGLFRKTDISKLKKNTKYSMNKRVIGNKALFALGAGLISYGVLKDGKQR